MAEIKNKLRDYRRQAKLRQEDLAAAVGVTRQTIIAIEKGGYTPSLELAFKLAKRFNKPLEKIFQYED